MPLRREEVPPMRAGSRQGCRLLRNLAALALDPPGLAAAWGDYGSGENGVFPEPGRALPNRFLNRCGEGFGVPYRALEPWSGLPANHRRRNCPAGLVGFTTSYRTAGKDCGKKRTDRRIW